MQTSTFQNIKLFIVSATDLSKDALHIYAGLAIFIIAAIIFRKSLKSITPWLAVLFFAVIAELIDMRDDLISSGYWRWGASVHDILNTLFWPSVIFILARLGVLFSAPDKHYK